MKTGYITDSFSTLGGLASVAYGDPEYFREVQNQIYLGSPTRFLDMHRPSSILADFLGSPERLTEIVMSILEQRYQNKAEFADLVDVYLGADWRNLLRSSIANEFFYTVDSVEAYG